MVRRVFVQSLSVGDLALSPEQSHHLRDVLRLSAGQAVELFDDSGSTALAEILPGQDEALQVRVTTVAAAAADRPALVLATAVPKGDRADWMVEKLSELGVDQWIPLRTTRSVVHPSGTGKTERWQRIAVESAKQSRRRGLMKIAALLPVERLWSSVSAGWVASTAEGILARDALVFPAPRDVTIAIGPEGGWTVEELAGFAQARWPGISLGTTILRVETAAVAAAAIARAFAI